MKPVTVKAKPGDAARGAKPTSATAPPATARTARVPRHRQNTFSRPRDLPILASALNNPGFLRAASDDFLKTVLVHGRRGTPIPPFLKQGLKGRDTRRYRRLRARLRRAAAAPASARRDARRIGRHRAQIAAQPRTNGGTAQTAFSAANLRIIRTVPLRRGHRREGKENKSAGSWTPAISTSSTRRWPWTHAWGCSCPAA